MEGQEQAPKLLDQVRNVLRLHHYSIHTERSYIDWIKRYVQFHQMRSREDLADGERKIEAFLTDLAVRGKVAASTQNQAMNALVFLYRKVLQKPLDEAIDAVRAERKRDQCLRIRERRPARESARARAWARAGARTPRRSQGHHVLPERGHERKIDR